MPPKIANTCQCHLIDWLQFPDYKYFDGDEKCVQTTSVDCQVKVNEKEMSMKTYMEVCKYIPGEEGSKFPESVYKKLLGSDEEDMSELESDDEDLVKVKNNSMSERNQIIINGKEIKDDEDDE